MLNRAKEVLKELEGLGYNAYVAGGFIRDLLNGITPKDIDIFITGTKDAALSAKTLMNHYGDGRWYCNYGEMDMRDDVQGVLKVGDDLDIIFMQDAALEPDDTFTSILKFTFRNYERKDYSILDTVRNFDVSICGCYGSMVGDDLCIAVTEDYLDWEEKGIIYQYTNIMTTQNHLDRVKNKFNVELTPKEMSGSMGFKVKAIL